MEEKREKEKKEEEKKKKEERNGITKRTSKESEQLFERRDGKQEGGCERAEKELHNDRHSLKDRQV